MPAHYSPGPHTLTPIDTVTSRCLLSACPHCYPVPWCATKVQRVMGGVTRGGSVRRSPQYGRGTVRHAFPLPQDCSEKFKPSAPWPAGTTPSCLVPPTGMVSLKRIEPWFQVPALHLRSEHGDPWPLPPCLEGSRSAHPSPESLGSRSSEHTAHEVSTLLRLQIIMT